jgi:lysozyme family protein
MPISLTPKLREEYQRLFDTCQARPETLTEARALTLKLLKNRARYELVGEPLGIPWYFIGAIHTMECSQRFTLHLHNGDPLTAKTVRVPKNRPLVGTPPFTWEQSATDALKLRQLNNLGPWDTPFLLYQLEGYNGFGYRLRKTGVNTPYLWAASNHFSKGKFVQDGKFDPEAPSKQIGAAVLIQRILNVMETPAEAAVFPV